MDYAEALKKVRTEKLKDNFMVIQLDGGDKVILPHKDAVVLLDALTNAEKFDSKWLDSTSRIEGLEQGYITSSSLSRQEYERYKIAGLLNISIHDVKAMEAN